LRRESEKMKKKYKILMVFSIAAVFLTGYGADNKNQILSTGFLYLLASIQKNGFSRYLYDSGSNP